MRQLKKYKYFGILSVDIFVIFLFIVVFKTYANSASIPGSNGAVITLDSNFEYINNENNSSVIGNYFEGYYQDSVNGRFYSNASHRVKITGATTKCGDNIYGYSLGGYAYSDSMGYVDFDYNDDTFVYYCSNDESLHGYAYSRHIGYQNFDGINIGNILTRSDINAQDPVGNEDAFLNSDIGILDNQYLINGQSMNFSSPSTAGGGQTQFVIPGADSGNIPLDNLLEFIPEEESLFYIVK